MSHFVRGIWGDCHDSMSQNQPSPQIRMTLVLMRMAPMHNNVDAIKTSFEERLISFEFEGVRHHTC